MKKAVFFFALILSVSASAQKFQTQNAGGFDVENSTAIAETIQIDGQTFNLFETDNGSRFIKCLSPRTGNLYPVWIGTPTDDTFEGRTVYVSSKGSFCVYKVSNNSGNPYAVWLKVVQ